MELDKDTSKLIWKYLSSSNLLYRIQDLEITDIEKISTIEKATHDKNYSEEELFEFYKRFQFSINQLLNTQETYKSLSSIEAKALVYQRLLLTEQPKLKLELMKILKDIFESEGIGNAFDEELKKFLTQIDVRLRGPPALPACTKHPQILCVSKPAGNIRFGTGVLSVA